jgi:acetoin:2,6-dichlorophenolindophenol oxidoreductase subunit beta
MASSKTTIINDLHNKPDHEIISYRDALFQTMRNALSGSPNTIIIGQGVDDHKGTFGSTLNLAQEFGNERVIDTPLAEEAVAGIAIGAALNGLYPIQTHIRLDFVLLAMNQIVNLAAKYKYMFGGHFEVPMLIRMVVGRSWGQGAQHSQSLQSLFAHIPGLTVIMPSDSQAVIDSYAYAVNNFRGPVISIEHRLLYDIKFKVNRTNVSSDMPWNTRILRRGKDVTVVATSIMVLEALRSADYLAKISDIDCEIIDLSCVSHPDTNLIIQSVEKTGKLLIADTSWSAYGVCAEICRIICENKPSTLKAPVVTVGMQPAPCPTAKSLEDMFYPNLKTLTDDLAILVKGNAKHGLPLPDENSFADVYKRFKGPF